MATESEPTAVIRAPRVVQWRGWKIVAYRQAGGTYVANASRPVRGGTTGFNVEDISEAGAIKRAQRRIKDGG